MARTATITVSPNTNRDTMHIGPFIAVVTVANRQTTRVGTTAVIREVIKDCKANAKAANVELSVKNETGGKFTE